MAVKVSLSEIATQCCAGSTGALLACVLSITLAACSSSDDSDGDSTGSTDTTQSDASNDTQGPPDTGSPDVVEAIDMTPDPSCVATWVVEVRGMVVDASGAPMESAKAQVCIRKPRDVLPTCLRPADTNADGEFAVVIPEAVRCMAETTMRVIYPLTDRATQYCHVDLSLGGPILDVAEELKLYDTVPATTLPDEGDGESIVTVVFEDGLEIDVLPSEYYGPDAESYGRLAAARLDDEADTLCFLEGQPELDGLYALSPEGDVNGESFAIRIPNSTDLAPNTFVTLYVLGGLSTVLEDSTQVAEGAWYPHAIGQVSSDGEFISGELPYFSWFGYSACSDESACALE